MKLIVDSELQTLLDNYNKAGEEIHKYIIKTKHRRFSSKKFVADLGEYYFYINCKDMFLALEQKEKATADYDFSAKPNPQISYQNFDNLMRIEVKTRHAQVNDPYLLGVNKEKFDLLVFVHLNENYSCRFMGIMKKDKLIIKGKQNRLVFNNNVSTVWESAPFKRILGKQYPN